MCNCAFLPPSKFALTFCTKQISESEKLAADLTLFSAQIHATASISDKVQLGLGWTAFGQQK
jgi:hypothetical protein